MGQTPDDLRHDVERARRRLDEDLNQLEYSVKTELDWRVQFHRHPWMFLGAAFAAAALVGMALSAGSRS